MTASPLQILHKTLSSRPSSHSSANREAAHPPTPFSSALSSGHLTHPLHVIGRGSCGTIFADAGTSIVLKKGTDTTALRNDFLLTNRMAGSMLDAATYLPNHAIGTQTQTHRTVKRSFPRIPRCHSFLLHTDPQGKRWWAANQSHFPADGEYESDNQPSTLFSLDRIPPIHTVARRALIEQYFDAEDVEDALNDRTNDACLIRIYLGQLQQLRPYDDLLNFELHLEQMRDLGLDTHALAAEIAQSLAIAHWAAQIDCRDTEFVLGGAEDGTVHLYMLDFDKARSFSFSDSDVVDKLKAATMGNDAYFPDPVSEEPGDRELWEVFRDVYLETARAVLERRGVGDGKVRRLPEKFVRAWVGQARENAEVGDGIVFG